MGTNDLGEPIYEEEWVDVPDVLIGLPTTTEITDAIAMFGKRVDYTLGIPKGDTHNWINTDVIFWGEKYQTIGFPVTGEKENIPLKWGQNVKVVKYG